MQAALTSLFQPLRVRQALLRQKAADILVRVVQAAVQVEVQALVERQVRVFQAVQEDDGWSRVKKSNL